MEMTSDQLLTVKWWTLKECANRWRVSTTTVTRWLERGDLVGKKFGGQWRVTETAVNDFEKDGVPQPKPAAPKADLSEFENATPWV